MKILHLISSGGLYGAEAVILNLERALRGGPYANALGVFSNSNPQFEERARAEGVETYSIPCRGQLDASVPGAIRRLAREVSADVVHAHGYKADVYLWMAQLGQRLAMVSTCHTWYDNDLAVRVYGAVDRAVLRRFARVIAVSDEVRLRLRKAGVAEERIRLIRNGIDLRPYSGARVRDGGQRPLVVGLVGRLAPEKGVDVFLRAAARVLRERPETRFVVVGEGPERAALEGLIGELGIGASASLRGHVEDMPEFYGSLDLLVSASRQEGLPMALLEGMASGLPMVATAVGAVGMAVRDGQTGALVEPEQDEALGAAMLRLLEDAELRERYGAAARAVVAEEFSAERMAAEYVRVYEEAAGR